MAQSFAKAFYNSKSWEQCRNAYIVSVYGLCEQCNKPGFICHHKTKLTPSNINCPDITLNFDNLTYLCLTCHNEAHGKVRIERRYMFDSSGNVIPIAEDNDE